MPKKCYFSQKPIDYIYERKENIYNIDRYPTDESIVKKVQSGKGDEVFIYSEGSYKNLYIEAIFAGTTPEVVT